MEVPGYSLTSKAPVSTSSFGLLSSYQGIKPEPGAYDYGVFSIPTDLEAKILLREWTPIVGEDSVALVTTGFGDVFFYTNDQRVMFLNVQYAQTEFVDDDPDWFVNQFLHRPKIANNVLRIDRFRELVAHIRPLTFLETFILNPWLSIGGVDRIDKYTIGKCDVYLDLVAQTVFPSGSRNRA